MANSTVRSDKVYWRSAEEAEAIKLESLKDGLKISTWIRDTCLAEVRRRRDGAIISQRTNIEANPSSSLPPPAPGMIYSKELGRMVTLEEANQILSEPEEEEKSLLDGIE